MFVDRVTIQVTGGAGGDGARSFRREKYVPFGGPDGGDGGNGGDVYIAASPRMHSLLDLRYQPLWRGERGVHGQGKKCHGKQGAPVVIHVPLGTVVKDAETGAAVADLVEEGQRFLAAAGGKGGRGNARFTTSTNQAPKFAEKGEPGASASYVLELKVIADVGLVGLPNAGKSTLLAALSAARPKIADYPFTTLSPNLGVAQLSGYRTLTVADIPGIIEGAAEGKGLGHDFLRHIERTRVLAMLIDLGDPDPAATRDTLERELAAYSPAFAARPRIHVLNKADVTEYRANAERLRGAFPEAHVISAATGEGVDALLEAMWEAVERARAAEAEAAAGLEAQADPPEEYAFEAPFTIAPEGGGFRISGKRAVRAVQMTDFENDEAVRHLQRTLSKMGVFRALRRLGAAPGQPVFIGEEELDYRPD